MLALALLAFGATFPGVRVHAATAADSAAQGRALFDEADARDSGYADVQVQLRMVLRDSRGRETERSLRIRQLEMPADGDRVLVIFDTPANIRGTALLSHGHIEADDDQWLFLPALKRTKKIASRNKSGPFVGSEFSFEDLSPREVNKYTYNYVGQETLNGRPCHAIDRMPTDAYSGYSKQRVWLDSEHLRIEQIDYVNRRGETAKRLTVSGYQQYLQRFWRPAQMHMQNLQTGKSTTLYWQDYAFNQGFDADRDFSVNSLRRAR